MSAPNQHQQAESQQENQDDDAFIDPNEADEIDEQDLEGDIPMEEDDDEDEEDFDEEAMGRFRVVGEDGEEFMGDEVEEAPEDNSLGHSGELIKFI